MIEGLYAIVDVPHPHGLGLAEHTAALVGDGTVASAIQLRAKLATTDERRAMLKTMAPICKAAGVPLIVNDDVDAALQGMAGLVAGVHLGQDDRFADSVAGLRDRAGDDGFVVGLSTHDLAQLREACALQPDYVALGPIGPTGSKADPDPVVGLERLLEACRVSARPVVAIGGLNGETGSRAIEIGASAVAVISALVRETADQTADVARELAQRFRAAARPLPFADVVAAIPVLPPEQLAELARWGDDLAVHIGLGLPARFGPEIIDGAPAYRPSDLLDLLYVLDKQPGESWEAWKNRAAGGEVEGALVQLRRP